MLLRFSVYSSAALTQRALGRREFLDFHPMCECGTAYIVATQADGARFRMGGEPAIIASKYEAIL